MSSEESRVVMLSSIQGETRFDKYDPLGIISPEPTSKPDDAPEFFRKKDEETKKKPKSKSKD